MGGLPRLIVLKSHTTNENAYDTGNGYVCCLEKSVFSPSVKIEVETSKFNNRYVHLRFFHTNKYWGQAPNDKWIVPSKVPVEDQSKSSYTLFEPRFGKGKQNVYFAHVQSGGYVYVLNNHLRLSDKSFGTYSMFTFVDWETLVQLPKHVTFKADNDKYLKAECYDCRPYLKFSGGDFNHDKVAYEVFSQPDGHIQVKSVYYDKFWRSSPHWIWADSKDTSGKDANTLFWPIKMDSRTIALRNAGNNLFCKRQTMEGKYECLKADSTSITHDAKFLVEELVLERSIYNVRFRMEDARIYDVEPFVAGIGTATNNSDTESTLAIKVSYVDTSSRSFTYTFSLILGVKTTIQTGIPKIVKGEIEVSASITNTFTWGEITTTSKSSEATYTCKVPPKSRVTVNYVGTKGKCDVPFSYTQKDKRSNDGSFVTSQHIDGIFNGVNNYNYRFEQLPFEAIR